jgi:hypothetical protein
MENNNQVAVIENSIELLKKAPQILQANQIRKSKAIEVGNNILVQIDSEGMNTAIDERAMKYLANVNAASKDMKEQRAGVTQIMDQLKKMYTEVENELDIKKPGTIPAQIQEHRNKYATQLAQEAAEKKRQAELVAAKQKAYIEIVASIESQFAQFYGNLLLAKKTAMHNSFNQISLADFGEKSMKLKAFNPTLNPALLSEFKPTGYYLQYHSQGEIAEMIVSISSEKIPEYSNNYVAELEIVKDELIERLPSKLNELNEQKRLADERAAEAERQRIEKEKSDAAIAAANAEQRKILEAKAEADRLENERKNAELLERQQKAAAEQADREAATAARIKEEAEENKRKADLDIEVKKQGEQTMVMFEQEAATAELNDGPSTRQGVEITVLHPVGYTQIFALWFDAEGKNLPLDKLGNTKLDQMKAWCEKKCLKDGTKIESKFLEYTDNFKAVNKKAK